AINQSVASGRQIRDLMAEARTGSAREQWFQTGSVQPIIADIDNVGILAGFVFDKVLGDKQTAQKLSQGMQVASMAVKLGMLFATGGVGMLAVAGSLVSGLEGLGGRSEGEATGAMFQQLSSQISQLRQEMHARFDRLEELQLRALRYLDE